MASSPHRRRRPGHCPAPAPATAVPLLLGSAAYTASVVEVGLATGLDPPRDYLSELAAADQPLGGLFRATDLVAGLAVLAGSASALPLLPRRRWAAFRAGRGTWSLGAGQRLQILLVAVWIGTLAVCVARHQAPDGTADGRQVRHTAQSPQVRAPARPMPPREGCHPKPPP
ncbi:DUF998 domain-containing protein [Streptomyces sp. NPDC054933]